MEISSWAGRGLSNKNVHAMTHTKKLKIRIFTKKENCNVKYISKKSRNCSVKLYSQKVGIALQSVLNKYVV